MSAEWLAADWGLSRLRLWAMRGAKLCGGAEFDIGAASLKKNEFENALLKAARPWLGKNTTPVYICGMAGSRQGWQEAPYRQTPCAPVGENKTMFARAPCKSGKVAAFLIAGLSQQNPADVMRGEETQIAGLLAQHPSFDGAVCLPGSHTKWARVKNGKVRRFTTMMTGEMFALLSQQSALRHSTSGEGFDMRAFNEAATTTMRRPTKTMSMLFSVRAESLLKNLKPAQARARLSGYCIGADIAAAASYCRAGTPVTIIGARGVGKLYQSALSARGIKAEWLDGGKAALKGLCAARKIK